MCVRTCSFAGDQYAPASFLRRTPSKHRISDRIARWRARACSEQQGLTPARAAPCGSGARPPLQSLSVSALLICVAHLVQLPQHDLGEVKGGEADPHGDGPFDPVHAQTFVEPAHQPLLGHDLPHGAQDGAVRVARHPRGLHAPPHHVQGVRRRLADQTRAGPERQALVGVRLGAPALLYEREEDGNQIKN